MQIEMNSQRGIFSFRSADVPGMVIHNAGVHVRYHLEGGRRRSADLIGSSNTEEEKISDVHGLGTQAVVHQNADQNGARLTYKLNKYNTQPFILMKLTIQNQSKVSMYLDEFCLLQANPKTGGRLQISETRGETRFFKVGWHGWSHSGLFTKTDHNSRWTSDLVGGISYTNPATPRPRSRGEFWSEGWAILAGEAGAVVAGLASTARQFGQVHVDMGQGTEILKLVTQADGIRLDPGEICSSEWGYLQFIQLPHQEPSHDYVSAVSRQMNACMQETAPLPMWTHWYHFYHDISEEILLETLDGLGEKRVVVPYQVVELDDGYQSAWGDWTSTNSKFPQGLGQLATNIKEKGYTPGLWLAPFTVEPKAKVGHDHPDWLVVNGRGKPINAGRIYKSRAHALDTSNPKVLEHLRGLMDTVAHEWGYGMVKVDFLYMGALPGRRHNPKLTRAESLRLGLEAIRQGVGEDTFILGCGCPFGPAIGIVDAMRIGADTAPTWEPSLNWAKWADPIIKKEVSVPSLRNNLRNTLNLSTLHKYWWWNDPDCLLVRDSETSLTTAEVQSAVTLVGLSGGLFVSSDDIRSMNPERLNWASLLVPNLGLRGLPVDWLEKDMPQLYRAEMECDDKSWQAVGVFNWSNIVADCYLRFDALGYPSGTELDVFDFWNKSYTMTTEDEMVFKNVPAHGCRLLRISERGDAPHIVGDTLHISMGGEIASCRMAEGMLVIEMVDCGRWVRGELWVSLPKEPIVVTCNGEEIVFEQKGENVYALQVSCVGKGRLEVVM